MYRSKLLAAFVVTGAVIGALLFGGVGGDDDLGDHGVDTSSNRVW
jgi:hypothetical protein